MPFSDGTETQDEAVPAFRRTRLVGMGNNARIEQCRRFEGIFVQKIGADQLPLYLAETCMSGKGVLHFIGAGLENLQQVAVAALKIFEDIGQLAGRCLGIKR